MMLNNCVVGVYSQVFLICNIRVVLNDNRVHMVSEKTLKVLEFSFEHSRPLKFFKNRRYI